MKKLRQATKGIPLYSLELFRNSMIFFIYDAENTCHICHISLGYMSYVIYATYVIVEKSRTVCILFGKYPKNKTSS